MQAIRFSHVAISVVDLAAQRKFYSCAFGLSEVTVDLELKDRQARLVILRDSSGLQLQLVEHQAHEPASSHSPSKLQALGYFSWSLIVDDLDTAFSDVVAAGAAVISRPAAATRPGVRFCYLADPEGNMFELLQLTSD